MGFGKTTDSETDAEGNYVEAELHRLQRQLRQHDNERKSYGEESRSTLARQTNMIENLRRNNQILKEEQQLLKLQLTEDRKQGSSGKSLSGQLDHYKQKLQEITQALAIVDKNILEMTKQMAKQRNELGANISNSASKQGIRKQIQQLEGKMDKALIKFNKHIESNIKLREQVDVLRRERIAFDGIYQKNERELQDLRRRMKEIINGSHSAYEAREEAQTRMIALKEKSEKEQQNFVQEVKELERQLEQDRKLREFMIVKNAERLELTNEPIEEAQPRRGSIERVLANVEALDEQWRLVQEETKCKTLEEFADHFKQIDEENFSLFNYINEMNKQIELMQAKLHADERQKPDQSNRHIKSQDLVRELEGQLAQLQEQTNTTQKLKESTTVTVSRLAESIAELANALNVETAKRDALDDEEFSFKQTYQTLLSVEQKANELLQKNIVLAFPKKLVQTQQQQQQQHASQVPLITTGEEPAQEQQQHQTQDKEVSVFAAVIQSIQENGGIVIGANGKPVEDAFGKGPAPPIKMPTIEAPMSEYVVLSSNISAEDESEEDQDESDLTEAVLSREQLRERMLKNMMRKEIEEQQEVDSLGMLSAKKATAAKSNSSRKHSQKK